MAKVKFITRTKYHGDYFPAYTPVDVNDSDLSELQKIGAVVLESGTTAKEEGAKSVDKTPDFASLTVAELTEYAKDHGIDISGVTKKADIVKTIKEAGV